jgi:hypothetical protein
MPGFLRFFAGRTHHTDIFARRSFGSPQFPSYPFEHMPWSKTPVVTCILAKSLAGLLPSAKSNASTFLTLIARVILADHNYTFFGAQYRAYALDSSGSRLPLPGLPAEFTTELLAKLYSGRTFTCWIWGLWFSIHQLRTAGQNKDPTGAADSTKNLEKPRKILIAARPYLV